MCYDVIGRGRETIGRVLKGRIAPADPPWMWSLMDDEQTVATGYSESRDAATQALAEARLPGLMLKRTDRRDEECYDVCPTARSLDTCDSPTSRQLQRRGSGPLLSTNREGRKSNRGYAPTREAAMQRSRSSRF
jgi:hypothetical protein